jgi:hypothetical protein
MRSLAESAQWICADALCHPESPRLMRGEACLPLARRGGQAGIRFLFSFLDWFDKKKANKFNC